MSITPSNGTQTQPTDPAGSPLSLNWCGLFCDELELADGSEREKRSFSSGDQLVVFLSCFALTPPSRTVSSFLLFQREHWWPSGMYLGFQSPCVSVSQAHERGFLHIDSHTPLWLKHKATTWQLYSQRSTLAHYRIIHRYDIMKECLKSCLWCFCFGP